MENEIRDSMAFEWNAIKLKLKKKEALNTAYIEKKSQMSILQI